MHTATDYHELLHLLGPHLPTDRFRAILAGGDLPTRSQGAALLVDIIGFTPMTTKLFDEYGPQRAGEELKRRINPMFEAVAGLVFHTGGSVIRFSGDGFTAWFDDQRYGFSEPTEASTEHGNENRAEDSLPGVLRAIVAAIEMQRIIKLWRQQGLTLRVCIGVGEGERWIVGQPLHGLIDVLFGEAAQQMISLVGETQAGQIMVHSSVIALLRDEGISFEISEAGNALITSAPDYLEVESRRYRWKAWSVGSDPSSVVEAVRPFVSSAIREQVEKRMGNFVGELRYALPMFIQFAIQPVQMADERQLVHDFVAVVQDVLANQGGRLVSVELSEKGSVIFAVFGAPVSYGDDAVRAITAAIQIRDGASQFSALRSFRIGLSRGQLYAGVIGGEVRHEYSTIGDETNIAARLMTSAADRQILTTSGVQKVSEKFVKYADPAFVKVKGREEPITVVVPVQLQTQVSRRVMYGKLVGRVAELERLQGAVQAVQRGNPRIVQIEGVAGIGKTRLIVEAAALAERMGFIAATGQCVSTARTVACVPWREILNALLLLDTTLPLDQQIAQLEAAVAQLDPTWSARLPIIGEWMQLPIAETSFSSKLEGRTRRQAGLTLITDLLLRLAEGNPLLLVLDDTQWLDEISEALTIDLVRRLMVESAPVLLAIVHRTLAEADHPIAILQLLQENRHSFQTVTLEEMDNAEVYDLIERYLESVAPSELKQFVAGRAQGNPFFVQELLDTLRETDRIRISGTRVRVIGDLAAVNLPQTVQGLVQIRIDRLQEMAKLVLKVAAVIGREFSREVLKASIPPEMMSVEELADTLQVLIERDFLIRAEPEPDPTFIFKHAITQEVAYQTLPYTMRKRLHLAVAQALSKTTTPSMAQIAQHYAQAEVRPLAFKYALIAGQLAAGNYANTAAMEHYEAALDLASTPADRFAVLRQMADLYVRLGNTAQLKQIADELQLISAEAPDPVIVAAPQLYYAYYYTQTGQPEQVITTATLAIDLAAGENSDYLRWDAYRMLRAAYVRLHQTAAAEDVNKQMVALAKQIDAPRYSFELMLAQLEELFSQTPSAAIRGIKHLIRQIQASNDPSLEAEAWAQLAEFYLSTHQLQAKTYALRQSLQLWQQVGDRRGAGRIYNRLAQVLIMMGQITEANAHLNEAYRSHRLSGERLGESESLMWFGVTSMLYAANAEALAYFNRALAIQKDLNHDESIALTLFFTSMAEISLNNTDDAFSALIQARGLLRATSVLAQSSVLIGVEAALADIYRQRGNLKRALELIERLIPPLLNLEINKLLTVGLTYMHVIGVLVAAEQAEAAEQLRQAYLAFLRHILNGVQDPTWREGLVRNPWFNHQLLSAAEMETLLQSAPQPMEVLED